MTSVYVDTSALAKWYLNESGSEEFERFVLALRSPPAISTLTALEFRCLLARRRRAQDIDASIETLILQRFEQQTSLGWVAVHQVEDAHIRAAINLISRLSARPLRTLDALHLAIAGALGVATLATSDRVLAEAAGSLGLRVELFG